MIQLCNAIENTYKNKIENFKTGYKNIMTIIGYQQLINDVVKKIPVSADADKRTA